MIYVCCTAHSWIGIQTALIDYKPGSGIGNVNVMVNTELSPEQAGLITKNDNKYLIKKRKSRLLV